MGAADRPTRVRLVPDFRSSYTISAITFYELRKAMGTSKFMILVPLFDLKSLGPFRRLRCRDFKSAALARHCRAFCVAVLFAVLQFGASAAFAATPDTYDPWPGLVQDIFGNRAMDDGTGVIALEMPIRAEDAAIVPVTLRIKLSPTDSRRVRAITLVIDQNPAPMAARFELGEDSSVS